MLNRAAVSAKQLQSKTALYATAFSLVNLIWSLLGTTYKQQLFSLATA